MPFIQHIWSYSSMTFHSNSYSVSLPTSWLLLSFLMVALSSISAAHMCVGAKPYTRRGQDYQWPCLVQRRVAFSLPVDINSLHPLHLFCELDIWAPPPSTLEFWLCFSKAWVINEVFQSHWFFLLLTFSIWIHLNVFFSVYLLHDRHSL